MLPPWLENRGILFLKKFKASCLNYYIKCDIAQQSVRVEVQPISRATRDIHRRDKV